MKIGPPSNVWADQLLWLLKNADYGDSQIPFVSGLLAYTHKYGGLTERQAEAAGRIVQARIVVLQAECLAHKAEQQSIDDEWLYSSAIDVAPTIDKRRLH
jgi:hypothetical protein